MYVWDMYSMHCQIVHVHLNEKRKTYQTMHKLCKQFSFSRDWFILTLGESWKICSIVGWNHAGRCRWSAENMIESGQLYGWERCWQFSHQRNWSAWGTMMGETSRGRCCAGDNSAARIVAPFCDATDNSSARIVSAWLSLCSCSIRFCRAIFRSRVTLARAAASAWQARSAAIASSIDMQFSFCM